MVNGDSQVVHRRLLALKQHLTPGPSPDPTRHRLYDVDDALTAPKLFITQDPVGEGIQPLEKVVECQIRADQIRGAAVRAG